MHKPPYPPNYELDSTSNVFKDGFDIKQPRKVDMPLKKPN